MTSSNLFHCFQVVFDNILLTWTYFKVSLYTENGSAYLQMDPIRDLGESIRFMIERDLSAARFIANEALDTELPLLRAEFKHPETSYQKKYEEIFQCPVVFNARYNRFSFERLQDLNRKPQEFLPPSARRLPLHLQRNTALQNISAIYCSTVRRSRLHWSLLPKKSIPHHVRSSASWLRSKPASRNCLTMSV
jgi:hypothetical protein